MCVSSEDKLLIRPFVEDDEPLVVSLWNEIFSEDPPWNEPRSIIQRKLTVQRDLFLVGEINNRVTATVIAGYDGFRGWLYHLAVHSHWRRRGFGTQLLLEAEKRLLALGCSKINIQIRSSNAEAIPFYKSLGYASEEHLSLGKLL
jgi:ribosomal protein S18 acetylase RimI-like enzyme